MFIFFSSVKPVSLFPPSGRFAEKNIRPVHLCVVLLLAATPSPFTNVSHIPDPTESLIPPARHSSGMKNIEMKLEGTILTMKVDLAKDFGPSKSGKSITVASTEGNISVPGAEEIKVGLNVYKSKK